MTATLPALPEPQPTLPAFDYEKWEAEAKIQRAAIARKVSVAKITLFDILDSHGIAFVIVGFDGSGDSGQIDEISAHDETGIVELPDVKLPAINIYTTQPEVGTSDMSITDVIETLAYDLLEYEHNGWENNDGAYGEFRFDTADRSVTLRPHERFVSSVYFEDIW